MALKKKYVVQKSFRIDAILERDLEQLSLQLGRPQNDLVNYSLELLMKDNKLWFAENMLVEYFSGYFEGGQEESRYEDDVLCIDIKINEDCTTTYSYHVKDPNYKGEESWSKVYADADEEMDKIKESLRFLALHFIFITDESIEKYCIRRLDYR